MITTGKKLKEATSAARPRHSNLVGNRAELTQAPRRA